MNILDKIDIYLTERKKKWGKVTHPGILEVPEGKDVADLPLEHFVKLAKNKGVDAIVKALMNLYRWNKNDDPPLSKWAKNMQERLSAHFKKKD
ncbi:MAG: hypothetical protein ACOC56_01670 [Atribacterota bacterium]